MLVGVETKTMHDHLLQRDILPRIGLISEKFVGNWFGTFKDWPNTAAPEGLGGWGVWSERGPGEGEEGLVAWGWLRGEWEVPRTAFLYQGGSTP